MLRADFVGAKPTLDSACTARFMVSGNVLRRWRDFSLIPPGHGGRGLIRFGVTPPAPCRGLNAWDKGADSKSSRTTPGDFVVSRSAPGLD